MHVMLRGVIQTFAVLIVVGPSLGKNPPPLRGRIPPAVMEEPAVDNERPLFLPNVRALASGDARGASSSKLPYYGVRQASTNGSPVRGTDAVLPDVGGRYRLSWPFAVDAVPSSFQTVYNSVPSNDEPRDDNEPAVTAITKNGVTTYFTAWQKTLDPYQTRPYVARFTESQGKVTLSPPTAITLPSGYTDYGDSGLAMNPYDVGIRPYGLYLSGIVFNRNSAGATINPSSVRLWVSSDQGATWNSSGINVQSVSGSLVTYDKPTIDVSWYPPTLGWVYVTYVEFVIQAATGPTRYNRILLRRSPSGGSTRCRPVGGVCIDPFDPVVVVHDGADGGNAFAPSVAVNSINGNVYVVFTTYGGVKLKVSRDGGASFPGPAITIAPLQVIFPKLRSQLPATVVPIARFNPVTGKLMVVWHDRDPIDDLDVSYSSFDADTTTGYPQSRRYPAAYEQYQPTVDNDDTGNALISYYDAPQATSDSWAPKVRYVAPNGTPILGPAIVPDLGLGYGQLFTGDYHDIFYWQSRWNTAWTMPWSTSHTEISVTGVR
jgi:hypothetical protein